MKVSRLSLTLLAALLVQAVLLTLGNLALFAGSHAAAAGAPPLWQLLALNVTAVTLCAAILGRSLARPLRRMAQAAEAFGQGDLEVRVQLARRDELGDVARAFDEMAERVADLLRGERELLANISHELRTPLTRIRIALELVTEGDAKLARESVADIIEDLDELNRIIGDVLESSRLQLEGAPRAQGLPPLRIEHIVLDDLISRAASRFRTQYPTRRLDVSPIPEDVEIDGDPVQLRRAVENLLSNAHKYTKDPRLPITVAFEADAERVRLSVIDRGVGIAEANQKHLFSAFFRANRSQSPAVGGLGLGLLLVRRIVEAHGGDIRLESKRGEGTVVRVELPRA